MTYQPHIGSVLPIRNTPLPIDENTYAYFNFNDNLVSPINNTYPNVYHNNIMYTADLFEGISCKGKHRGGISIDEYTQNAILGSDIFSSGWTSYSNGNDGEFITELKTAGLNIADKQTWCGAYKSITLPSIGTYTLSVYVKPIYRTHTSINATLYTSGGGIGDTNVVASWSADKIGKWQRISMTKTFTTTSLIVYLICYGGEKIADYRVSAQYTMPQAELKAGYFTSHVISDRYSPYLYYNIDVPPKTISFWVKSNSNKVPTMASPRPLMLLGGELGSEHNTYLECMLTRSDDGGRFSSPNKIGVVAFVNNTSYHCSIDTIDPLDNQWHFVTIEINKGNKIGLWVDGKYAETASYGSEINFGSVLRVGHRYIPSSQSEVYTGLANCSYDDLCIRTAHYSEDEIHAWYQSNREFYNPYDYSVIV